LPVALIPHNEQTYSRIELTDNGDISRLQVIAEIFGWIGRQKAFLRRIRSLKQFVGIDDMERKQTLPWTTEEPSPLPENTGDILVRNLRR
jgi:hypothetical protein